MKKLYILLFFLAAFFSTKVSAQCVPSCSVYAVSPITFSAFPSSGTPISLSDDAMSGSIPIGFTFTFFCNSYNSILVCSNGWLTFDLSNSTPSYPGQSIPDIATPNNFVAFDWTDLNPSTGGTITYTTIGIAPNRQFILTYSNVPCYGTTNILNTCQTILFETSNIIEIHCTQIGNNNNSCTQGIENSSGLNGYWRPNANASNWTVTTPDAYRYQLGFEPTPPSSVSGSTLLCQGVPETYLALSMPGATAYTWAFPAGWAGTSTVSAINATAGVSGNLSVTATYTCGTSAPAILSVTTLSAPVMSISSTSVIICAGQSVTINGSGFGAISYTLDPTGTNGPPPYTVNPNLTTIYTLMGENAAGCVSNNSASITVTVKATPTVQVNSGSICLGEPFTMSPTGAETYNFSSLFATVTPSIAGITTYTVIGTNTTTGCSGDPAVSTVTVKTLPNVVLASNHATICTKESTTLTASGANTFSWISNSATSNSLVVSPTSSKVYTVIGTSDGCSKSATVSIVVKTCVGLFEQNNPTTNIQIYPNPTSGLITIETPKKIDVSIFDINGRLILSENMSEGLHEINLSGFDNGTYFLKTNDEFGTQAKVILKQ